MVNPTPYRDKSALGSMNTSMHRQPSIVVSLSSDKCTCIVAFDKSVLRRRRKTKVLTDRGHKRSQGTYRKESGIPGVLVETAQPGSFNLAL